MSERIDGLTFEAAVERLEALVSDMEGGSLSLDESLERFQQAVALSRYCAGKLEAAEKQVVMLTESGACVPFADGPRPPEDAFAG